MRDDSADEQDPDIVSAILQRVVNVAPGFDGVLAQQVEQQVRAEYGGRRFFVHKRAPRMTPRQRHAAFADGLSDMSTTELTKKHKISRATVYRLMKSGGRFGQV
ncbi:hypothetical protein [Candidatus Nitrotoga sp. M5]|uniref:hypothetical protein n=1 Tax=Candidatus Nitrotoga sp. M5 TaxID=2890409 RepID=UPI001EF6233C|nr:hypothetical protein [Candidatus Nitrotoga sp. M5]CAH1387036.1 Mor domain-containing protein [Candidatus Nitrotoga sp. M5]